MKEEEILLVFEKERETKGTWRFEEVTRDDEEPIVRTLYVRKSTLNRIGNPDRLSVAIRPGFRA